MANTLIAFFNYTLYIGKEYEEFIHFVYTEIIHE